MGFSRGCRFSTPATAELPKPIPSETSHQTDLEPIVDTPKELPTGMPGDAPAETSDDASEDALVNVVPFRAPGEAKPPSLTPVENNAFNELARQLSARLESETGMLSPLPSEVGDDAPAQLNFADGRDPASEPPADDRPAAEWPQWLNEPAPPPRGGASRDKALLDLMPLGVLIYRLDRLLYANRAFLDHMGYASLHALVDEIYPAIGRSAGVPVLDLLLGLSSAVFHDPGELFQLRPSPRVRRWRRNAVILTRGNNPRLPGSRIGLHLRTIVRMIRALLFVVREGAIDCGETRQRKAGGDEELNFTGSTSHNSLPFFPGETTRCLFLLFASLSARASPRGGCPEPMSGFRWR